MGVGVGVGVGVIAGVGVGVGFGVGVGVGPTGVFDTAGEFEISGVSDGSAVGSSDGASVGVAVGSGVGVGASGLFMLPFHVPFAMALSNCSCASCERMVLPAICSSPQGFAGSGSVGSQPRR